MDLGICMASHVGDIGYVVRAEELGYTHAWLADSQMLWSDCYATLALAATQTSKIKIGTGVAVSGTRPASVNAAGIATINAIAPGRTFFGVGAGNTARRVMGLPPQRIKDFERYLQEVVPLIRGEEADMPSGAKGGAEDIPIRHIMPDKGFVNFEDEIPVYISGFGPKSLALAGKYGDGAVLALVGNPAAMASVWHMMQEGAREIGREIGPQQNYYTTALTTMVVLEDDEAKDSDRVKSQCGAMAMAAVHYAYDQYRNFGHQPPNALAGIWEDYTALLETYPAERRHQRIHAGHNCWVLEEEERFLTPDVLEASCMLGTKNELIEQIRGLQATGLDQLMILPNFDTRFDVLEAVGQQILPNV
jgi:5,10-methylenetetrahydromethanopterin reductase